MRYGVKPRSNIDSGFTDASASNESSVNAFVKTDHRSCASDEVK